MPRNVEIFWTEGDWRCELHTDDLSAVGRLLVYRGETIMTAESVPVGTAAYTRAEILRQMIRRDLR
jgi:hypothetical protein